ncbi:glyoxylate/hydroxypyruvate reductase GhrB [Proteus vulgaris]|uniref:glyoxylate/hydroxypyruvate reductase GhrB n=1 Tax=Proteus TaxID=583 RepID=UPI001412FDE2|nr:MULTISPECIES: glyoxylate/hydroxypyruvate reductase GhrB [Proteus]NBM56089.1 glyoxylate/hydroxypyruvate reductase GhrB [Proteus sp. G2669]UDN34950.1 glyoxylate/hydroxypyruvate reductase GhrB [Proteus sp. NMG38-2]UPK80021.1 glyoxylate/hydroxypyruvate reductase GhrB [Proteus vulgaris]
MKPIVLLYQNLPETLYKKLSNFADIKQFNTLSLDSNDFRSALANASGLLGAGGNIDKNFIDHAPHLKAVSTVSVGYDNVDVNALTKRNIKLMHTPTVLTDTVADTMMALVLAVSRRIPELADNVKQGLWVKGITPDWYGTDVHHKTMGILGMGRIGKALAQRAHFGFNMNILYHSRTEYTDANDRFDAKYCDLDTLLQQSDFVCITLPLTPETHHLISQNQFSMMKPDAYLINAGRGAVVDEKALINALEQKEIAGAGLDVFETEPLSLSSPLLSMKNVVAVPHIGSATKETRYAMAECAVDNLIAALSDNVKENCVNF